MCNKNKPVNVIKMNKVFLKLNLTKLPFQSDKLFTAPLYSKQEKTSFRFAAQSFSLFSMKNRNGKRYCKKSAS